MSGIVHSVPGVAKCPDAGLPTVQCLRETMRVLGLSRVKLADRVRVSRSTVGRWLSGECPVSVEALTNDREIAWVFGVLLAEHFCDAQRAA